MPPKIYIDGQAGTTALRIRDWLAGRNDLEVVTLPEELRKEPAARKKALQDASIVLLCLPDDAAKEAAAWLADSPVRILDASTAHRVADDWVYGLPELIAGQREQIAKAKRVANPGCYSSAVILLTRPLVDAGLIAPDTPLAIHALSGYSGGGRALIERWEDPKKKLIHLPHEAPYSIGKLHKHIPEIMRHGALSAEPQFLPNVGPFRCGMRVADHDSGEVTAESRRRQSDVGSVGGALRQRSYLSTSNRSPTPARPTKSASIRRSSTIPIEFPCASCRISPAMSF